MSRKGDRPKSERRDGTARARSGGTRPRIESAESYACLLDQPFVGVVVIQGDPPRVTFANRPAAGFLGFTPEELVAVPPGKLTGLIHPEDREITINRYHRRRAGEDPMSRYEIRILAADGVERTIECFASPVAFAGRPASQVLMIDVSARRETERALAASEEKYRLLTDSAGEMIFVIDEEMRMLYVNRSFAAFDGRPAAEIVGKTLAELLPEAVARERAQGIASVLAKGERTERRLAFERKKRRITLETTLVPLRDPDGATRRVLGISRDVTLRQEAEEALRASEQKYRALAESARDFIFVHDDRLRLTYVNRAGAAVLGIDPAEVAGKTVRDLFPSDLASSFLEQIGRVLETGELVRSEQFVEFPGKRLWVETTFAPMFDEAGRVTGVLGASRDTSPRHLAEHLYRTISEASRDIIFVVEPDLRLAYVNTEAASILHRMPEEIHGKSLDALFPEELAGVLASSIRHVIDTGQAIERERFFPFREKGVWLLTKLSPIKDETGETHAIVGVARDITERKRAAEIEKESARRQTEILETTLRERTKEIEALEKQKAQNEKLAAIAQMAARIAHEIKNPLAGIQNSFALVRDSLSEGHEDHRYIAMIQGEIDRIVAIISRMTRLYIPLVESPRACALAECTRETVELLAEVCREKDVTVTIESSGGGGKARFQEGPVREILYNLILNAVDASPAGGVVRVETHVRPGSAEIVVSDDGPGIPPDIRESIFEPFCTSKVGRAGGLGLGLGLSITKANADSLGGQIEFQTEEGRGASFRVTLPIDCKGGGEHGE